MMQTLTHAKECAALLDERVHSQAFALYRGGVFHVL